MSHKLKLAATVLVLSGTCAGVAQAASSPAVTTGSASSLAASAATLNGTVSPNGAKTYYGFELGLTKAYGLTSALTSAGAGTDPVPVSVRATGLIPGTRYHYRLLARNRFGGAVGADRTFTTTGHPPPGVATGPATQLGTSFATLTGTVNPNGELTGWAFEYGLTPLYGTETFGGTVSASSPPRTVSRQIQGLAPGTTFHYRLVALHGSTVASYGADQTFTTLPSPRPVPRVRATTVPRRARRRPYVFASNGLVLRPSSTPAALGCTGNVEVRYLRGRHQVGLVLTPIQPNCTFAAQARFNRLPGRGKRHRRVRLRVLIRFAGNGYLAPADARPERVTLG
jgi:hypothetical protein